MDVTNRYARDFSKRDARIRAPEGALLYILDEIRSVRRTNISKEEKSKLEAEDREEYYEMQGYLAQRLTKEIFKTADSAYIYKQAEPDGRKAAEAREEREAERLEATGLELQRWSRPGL
jgi:peptide-N4-(N-acetyl-beta-glucosaminyl)asparagine amidase